MALLELLLNEINSATNEFLPAPSSSSSTAIKINNLIPKKKLKFDENFAYCLFMYCAVLRSRHLNFNFEHKNVSHLPSLSPSTYWSHTTLTAAVKLPFSRRPREKEISNVNKTCRGGCFHIV